MRAHVRAKLISDDSLRGDEFRFLDSSDKDLTPEFLGQKPQPEVTEAAPQLGANRRKENRYNGRGGGGGNRNGQRRNNRPRPERKDERR